MRIYNTKGCTFDQGIFFLYRHDDYSDTDVEHLKEIMRTLCYKSVTECPDESLQMVGTA